MAHCVHFDKTKIGTILIWFTIAQALSILLDWMRLGHRTSTEKDLEILILRHQLSILQRKYHPVIRPSRSEKLILAVLVNLLKRKAGVTNRDLRKVVRIVRPETVLKWHRELVKRKWTYQRQNQGGRPKIDTAVKVLILRFARDNAWGNGKIVGELQKLGHSISEQTVANILKRHGIPPLPERQPSLSWKHLMTHYKDQLLACDFFTIETLFLQTIYVLFFIEIGTRRIHFAGCTTHPDQLWVTQQARQLMWELDEQETSIRFLIHDRDTKFPKAFDTVFQAEGIDIIRTPIRAPNANAYAERWVRTVREECFDKLIIINQVHLKQVMREYVTYYNTARPHQGIQQRTPIALPKPNNHGQVRCRDVLGGLIHDYYRDAG
jgi:putative transposase